MSFIEKFKMSSKSEDIVGETWDYCFADSLIKVGSGLAVGSVLSLVMFKTLVVDIVTKNSGKEITYLRENDSSQSYIRTRGTCVLSQQSPTLIIS
ncbi:UNVERIFIED_CONTAM: hypothetical protein NCL1_38664 [Trichonephila clavipes]